VLSFSTSSKPDLIVEAGAGSRGGQGFLFFLVQGGFDRDSVTVRHR